MRWIAKPLDFLRELRKVKPTVVHLSGHGRQHGGSVRNGRSLRELATGSAVAEGSALCFQSLGSDPQLVSTEALAETLAAAGASVRLVVLNACWSDTHAAALLPHCECVIDVAGPVQDKAARSFAEGFYGGVGDGASIAAAFRQGQAAIRLAGLSDCNHLRLQARNGVDAAQIFLAPTGVEAG